jgi:hypothetical protein
LKINILISKMEKKKFKSLRFTPIQDRTYHINENKFFVGNEYATLVFQIQTYWIIVESEVVQVDKNNFRRFQNIYITNTDITQQNRQIHYLYIHFQYKHMNKYRSRFGNCFFKTCSSLLSIICLGNVLMYSQTCQCGHLYLVVISSGGLLEISMFQIYNS